jgi:ABC-type transport system involved in multi-copper enzyme maturation permease subunit
VLRTIVALIAGFAIMAFTILIATVVIALAMGVQRGTLPTSFLVTMVIVSALASALGGYSSASLAQDRPTLHAAILATMIFVQHVYTILFPIEGQEPWYTWSLAISGPVFALLGGVIRQRTARARPKPA